jgi:phosphatidylcholine synthase
MERLAAWTVHAYTATGVVLALLMVHLAYQGEVEAVLWLFLVSMVVDGTDGFLARHFQVKTVVPQIDGALLDNIVDYLTYAFAPMVLLWSTGYLPDGAWAGVVAAVPLLASCYQFCRTDAKGVDSDEHYFLGFPSYWNIVAFYVIVFDFSTVATVVLLLVFAVLVFVPVTYVYPSRTLDLWYVNMTAATLWLVAFGAITAQLEDQPGWLAYLSLAYVAYYTGVSLWLTFRARPRRGAEVPVAAV